MFEKKWAVVHDLSPFCVNIVRRFRSERLARLYAATSQYYQVMPTRDAIQKDLDVFEALQENRWDFRAKRIIPRVRTTD